MKAGDFENADGTGGESIYPENPGKGFSSSTFRLNVSGTLYGIGDARRGCVARVLGVFGGVWGV